MSNDPTPPPPSEPGRDNTPWVVALGALLSVIVIAAVAFVVTRDDGAGTITIAGRGDAAPAPKDRDAVLSVDGLPLPTIEDGADDRAIGRTIPTITSRAADGTTISIEPGTPTLIVVMAHWCPHCQAEIPLIVEWDQQGLIPSGLDIIGVSTAIDEAKGNYPPASWLEREQWPFPVIEDTSANLALDALGVSGFPTFIAVDADGKVVQRRTGELSEDEFTELVDAALAGAPASSDTTTVDRTTTPAPAGSAPCPAADGSSERRTSFDGPPTMCIDPATTYTAELDTSLGAFTIRLDPALAPQTVNNFVFLSRYHFYDGVTFHRVIEDFVIQGGDPSGDGTGGPGYEFADELPEAGAYEKYSLAMANAGPDTNGSQFFVITGSQGVSLPPSYTLFGKVTGGTDTVDAIEAVPTGDDDRPRTPVLITSVKIVEG